MRFDRQPASRWAASAAFFMLLAGSLAIAAPKSKPAAKETPDALRTQLDGKTPAQKIEFLDGMIEDGKTTKDVYFHLGNAKYESGDAVGAAVAFEKAVGMDSTFFKAVVNLGLMYDEQQLFPKAIEAFEMAARLDPKNPDVWSHLGNTYYTQREYLKAMDLYKKALELDPKSQQATYSIAVAFADAGIFREAVKYWTRVVEMDPNSEHGKNAKENIDLVKKYLIP